MSLKLIHRDSPESPLYTANLTTLERFQRDLEISKSRASYLQLLSKMRIENETFIPDSIRPLLTQRDALFTVDIGLGTPSSKGTFVFDTASWLTWTQCKPCIQCFQQKYPIFDTRTSTSYKMLFRNHSLSKWFKCNDYGCDYSVKYLTGESSRGIVSMETFTIQSKNRAPEPGAKPDNFSGVGNLKRVTNERIENVVFGCGVENSGSPIPHPLVGGFVGMDRTPTSLIRQLRSKTIQIFSYCLPPFSSRFKTSFVRFGTEAIIRREHIQIASFLPGSTNYKVNLSGISIAGRRLQLPTGVFRDGCLIDSGTSLSLIEQEAFNVMFIAFRSHFDQYKSLTRVALPARSLCYRISKGFNNFPTMTFHFLGANLEVGMTTLFSRFARNTFCLEMMGHLHATILGAYQQQNFRFVYDLDNAKVAFVREDCTKDRG
ncbi:unnamed protein product [Ilex paraguariensis]|uniref:Peptidase A1 domain-containing protein n=1 Tax=Ilex paraguariensis TaxID=185542 RepID=A0ABC8S3I0_9AQUA